jgi:hypothetical protein
VCWTCCASIIGYSLRKSREAHSFNVPFKVLRPTQRKVFTQISYPHRGNELPVLGHELTGFFDVSGKGICYRRHTEGSKHIRLLAKNFGDPIQCFAIVAPEDMSKCRHQV